MNGTKLLLNCAGSLVLLSVAVSVLPAQTATPSRKTVLFNGKDLSHFYTWLRENKYEDPKGVFSVRDGAIHISGEEWGGVATKGDYRDYRLVVEWKWGGAAHGNRKDKARDSGILVHGAGPDGAMGGTWLESYESQIIEGGTGDILVVSPNGAISLDGETRTGPDNQPYWQKAGTKVHFTRGRLNWYGRDPEWKDVIGFRGHEDVEKPVGEWNRSEVICAGDRMVNLLNGKVVNQAFNLSRTEGKIQIQSEGAEILIRKVELHPLKGETDR